MKCKICGGTLIYSDGSYICESCGNKFSVSEYYENIDTYICYVDSDNAGRRTKDSIIAQEIYQALTSNKISAFYARFSAAELYGDELEKVNNAAIHNAKTIIILGTQKENFERLFSQYKSFIQGKVIIPVFRDMDAYDIPKEISALQALDYGKIGAGTDLVRSLFNALGREQEANLVTISKGSANRKKRVLLITAASFVVLAGLFVALFFYLCPDPEEQQQIEETEEVDTDAMQYDEAMQCIADGDYAGAMKILANLSGYRNCDRQLLTLYSRYAGYFTDEETFVTLHFQVWEGGVGAVEITKGTTSSAQLRISESAQLQENHLSFSFNDSENNHGEGSLELTNKGLRLMVKTTSENSKISMGDFNVVFSLDEKSDVPFTAPLDADTLLEVVQSRTTMSQLNQRGYELVFNNALYKITEASLYSIKNTDISLAIFTYDITKGDVQDFYGTPETNVDDPIVFAVSAPAGTIIPDMIGEPNAPFVKNEILYVPGGGLGQTPHVLDFGIPEYIENENISNGTNVCFTSRSLIGDKLFDELVHYYLVTGAAARRYINKYPDSFPNPEILEIDDVYYLVSVTDAHNVAPRAIYQVNQKTYAIEEINSYETAIAEDLISNDYVRSEAYIGILNPQDINTAYAQYYNMVPGVYVYDVQSGSAAEKAGLQSGDIVVALGGVDIGSTSELNAVKQEYKAGDTTTIRVYRSGEYHDLIITFDAETPQ